jgi:tetratricopeptide (TPR) repeat protein
MLPRSRSEKPGPAESPEFGLIAGRYEVQAVVGRGGMGAVYRVRDQCTDRELALKRLHVRSRRKNQLLAHFEREFLTLAQLRHPRIIEVHDYGVDSAGAYYTMELLSGQDLRAVAPVPWRVACNYLREVATSLALLHARGLVHRDVTPQNVRVGEDGHCKLIDFGALAAIGAPGEVVGTPPCMPPEALDAGAIDRRLDLYALGALGYYLLTGHHAYPATDSRQLRAFWANTPAPPSVAAAKRAADQAPDAGGALPSPPAALDTLVMSLLALDPMARPSSAGAVIDRIDAILGGGVVEEASLAESYLASAPLCGRKVEVQKATAALQRVRRGRGTALTLVGASGVGRSRLLAEVALHSKLHGCTVLQVDASAHEGPYASVLALAEQLALLLPELTSQHARELARLQPAQARALQQLAPALAVSVGLRTTSVRPSASDEEPTRERALCVAALHGLFAEVARRQPVALLVDDVHRADEASLSVLGSLAHESRHLQLLVVVAWRSDDESLCDSALRALVNCSTPIELGALNERQLTEWLSAVFGDAPNLGRLCSFLHERTRGRAATVAALLRFSIARDELLYRDGTWALPNEPAKLALPADAENAALEQLAGQAPEVRALAAAISMHRGTLTLELCAALREPVRDATVPPASSGALRATLDALVECEVLIRSREGYRFASENLREALESRIDPAQWTALHRRMAEAILARQPDSPLDQLAAGVHLLEARDARGLVLASKAASMLCDRVEGISGSLRLLERALLLAREQGASATHRLAILGALGLGGYVADHRLVRYTEEIAGTLDEVTGLDLARRWQALGDKLGSWFGRGLGLLGLGVGVLRYYLRPRAQRPTHYRKAARWGVGALTALAGRAAICLDKPAVDRIVACLLPLRGLGLRDPGGFCVAYCQALAIAIQDRFTTTRQLWLDLEKNLSRPGAMLEVPLEQRRLWHGGVAYALGLFESFAGDPSVLSRAEALEASGSDMHAMIAAQLRLQYHGFRGEAEQVRKAYERMEACAIQIGSSWQVETWSAISINLFASLWHDVILAKRAMRETQRMKDELPSLLRYAITSEALYLLRRGQPRDAVGLYEPLLAQEPELSRIGWCTSHGILADAYNQLGMHAEALAVCERVLALADHRDRGYFAMRIDLDLPYAVALDALGEHGRAVSHLESLLESYATFGSPLALGSVHETLARIAFARGDSKRFTDHLKQVESYFTKLGNPALIARFQGLGDLVGGSGGILSKVAVMREVRAFDAAIEPLDDREAGARAILAWLMRSCEGYDGYLFVAPESEDDEPALLAATSDREPAAEVFETVASSLQAFGGAGDTTNHGTGAASCTQGDGAASHVYLLSWVEADAYHAEGALVLLGRAPTAPPVRYELLQAAAQQLRRLVMHAAS